MKKRIISILLLSMLTISSLTGCSHLSEEMIAAMDNNEDIALSVTEDSSNIERNDLSWVELDQLTTFPDIRKQWDDTLQITRFDTDSKNGCIFVNMDGSWAGNNTLYNAMQNKIFVETYWNDGKVRSALSQCAISEFSDIDNEGTGIIAGLNAYFDIMPTNKDKTSGLFNYLTRAEAMSSIYKADSQVILNDADTEFTKAVGESQYNNLAQAVDEDSYLHISDGSLNKYTYNTTMTKAEAIYIIVQRYFKEEYEAADGISESFSDCKNAGDIASKLGFKDKHSYETYELEYSLQNSDKGAPEALYKALCIAKQHGIISADTGWNRGINGGELLTMLVNTYTSFNNGGYKVNAKTGANSGKVLVEEEVEDEPEKTEESIGSVAVTKISDLADIDDLIKAYKDEINMTDEEIAEAKQAAEGFTIQEFDKYMLVDNCNYLNVRIGPSTDYRILKSVPNGTRAHIVGICAENGWYRVIADGKISYQCGVYFSDVQ